MEKVVEITCCKKCGKPYRKDKLLTIHEFWSTSHVCKECYLKFQRSQWGYW
jgi:hypothetical protein